MQHGYISLHLKKLNLLVFHIYSQAVLEIVHQAMADPQRPSLEEDTDAKVISRYICSTNTIHQADQILRRCVSLRMVEAKGKQYALSFILSFYLVQF